MAYLHCHACGWSQDDFWNWRYNPLTKLWDCAKWLIRPRWMELDGWLIDDLVKYTGVAIYRRRAAFTPQRYNKDVAWSLKPVSAYEQSSKGATGVFSWQWLWLEVVKEWKLFVQQRWWTYASWKKARKRATCPKCKQKKFDID
jgi:hypothetical protein